MSFSPPYRVVLVALAAAVAIACGGDSGTAPPAAPAATPRPSATPSPEIRGVTCAQGAQFSCRALVCTDAQHCRELVCTGAQCRALICTGDRCVTPT
jgi:hypothetical protein